MPRQDKMRRQSKDAKFSRDSGEEIDDDGSVQFFQLDRYLAMPLGTPAAILQLQQVQQQQQRKEPNGETL